MQSLPPVEAVSVNELWFAKNINRVSLDDELTTVQRVLATGSTKKADNFTRILAALLSNAVDVATGVDCELVPFSDSHARSESSACRDCHGVLYGVSAEADRAGHTTLTRARRVVRRTLAEDQAFGSASDWWSSATPRLHA